MKTILDYIKNTNFKEKKCLSYKMVFLHFDIFS